MPRFQCGSAKSAAQMLASDRDPHWKRGMLGTATLSVPLGVFGHGSRKNPTNAKLLTISARRFKRVDVCVEINQCVGCTFTKSFLGDDAAILARSSGEEPASPRHRAGAASMAWRTTR